MYEILLNGGIAPGGLNFDAHVRRPSFEPIDLVYAHIVSMDTYARGLKIAQRLIEDRALEGVIETRYESYSRGIGHKIVNDQTSFGELEAYAFEHDQIENASGRQELLEGIVNSYL
jgi:xylose isomerase